MSDNKKTVTELNKLKFEGKVTDLARTRRQQHTSTPIKQKPEDNNRTLDGSEDVFESFTETENTITEGERDSLAFAESLVDLSIESVFEKVKINKNKMTALSVDKMLNMLPGYSGTPRDLSSFIRIADLIFAKIPDGDTETEPIFIQVVLSKLTGSAQFLCKNGASFGTWELLKTELKKQFTQKLKASDLERTLNQTTQRNNESVRDFSLRIKEIWFLLLETLDEIKEKPILEHYRKDFEAKAISAFCNSLKSPLWILAKSRTFTTFLEAETFVLEEEAMVYRNRNIPQILGRETNNSNRNMEIITRQMGNTALGNPGQRRGAICFFCKQVGHIQSNCPALKAQHNQAPIYRNQNFNRGFNPSFNRNAIRPMQSGQQNQNRFNMNASQDSKNYVNGKPHDIRITRSIVEDKKTDVPIYYTQ